jgi:Uma2 family endonuclease
VLNPDLLVVCNPIQKKYLDFAPALVTEILSPSTILKDRHTKFEIYQNAVVKYYLIIDPDEKSVEKYSLSKENTYVRNNDVSSYFLAEDCSINIDLSTIWE